VRSKLRYVVIVRSGERVAYIVVHIAEGLTKKAHLFPRNTTVYTPQKRRRWRGRPMVWRRALGADTVQIRRGCDDADGGSC